MKFLFSTLLYLILLCTENPNLKLKMILKKHIFLLLICASINLSFAQDPVLTKKDSTIVSAWVVGLGYNIVDDSGDISDKLLDVEDSWHAVPYPSRLSVGRYFKNGFGVEASAAYNKYKEGRRVDGRRLREDIDFFSIDARITYDLNRVFGQTAWFDPYAGVGVGFTDANNVNRNTTNVTVGFRTWINDKIGIDINSVGKWSINNESTNYLQHNLGVVYRLSSEKELNKKGEEKLALIKALEEERIRVKDSINLEEAKRLEKQRVQDSINKANEERKIANLKKKAAEEKAKLINQFTETLDRIEFEFDSAKLNSISEETISQLITLLNRYPGLVVEVSSHTDSRGSSAYNLALSKKRLKNTIDYILSSNIDATKVIGKAFGEEQLINECDNQTKCSEAKHSENRRSEIKIISD